MIAICAVLLVLVAAHHLFTLASVPPFYQRVSRGEVPTLIFGGASDVSPEIMATNAARRGLSLPAYAIYFLVLNFSIALGFWAAAGLVLWKRGDDWFRWLTALMLGFFPSGGLYRIALVAFPSAYPYLSAGSLLWPGFLVFLYLFPDGRAVPRWSRWPMTGFVLVHLAFQTFGFLASLPGPGLVFPPVVVQFGSWFILAAFGFILICQVYRYVRVAGPVERRQIQWFVVGIAFIVIGGVVLDAVRSLFPAIGDIGYLDDLDNVLTLVVPASIAIAILRYRLWDIDVIIRRTLIYSVLSALLALAYFGSVVIFQSVFASLTGERQSALATVLSTLILAALFGPLRGRVQSAIDRRFYRRKYDVARTLTAFGARLRDEVELNLLSEHLTAVVQDTMQPAHVSLWLKPPPARGAPGLTRTAEHER